MQRHKPVLTLLRPDANCLLAILLLLSFRPAAQPEPESQFKEYRTVGEIILEGNAITRSHILYRELLFRNGDTVLVSDWDRVMEASRKNLLNTSLFNFVTITAEAKGKTYTIHIYVIERWYIWPAPIFELSDRNFNAWWESRDYSRINYGFRVKWGNFRGRMENLDFILRFGKNQHFGIAYYKPYLDKKKRLGAGFEMGYLGMHEVGYEVQQDKLRYLYLEEYLLKQRYATVQVSYRKNIHVSHSLTATFYETTFSDTLNRVNADFFYEPDDIRKYITLYYKVKSDYRDARYYPLSGWYSDIEAYKAGIGLSFEGPLDILWVKTTSRYYLKLSQRFYAGFSLTGKLTPSSAPPYFFRRGLGYERDYIRGYEYYVVDGLHYLINRNALKYALIPQRTSTIDFISTPKFSRVHYAAYLNLFADAGYAWTGSIGRTNDNRLPETLLMGAGIGLDLVTYYDKVMRIEYSLNKLGESGIFIHFIAGI